MRIHHHKSGLKCLWLLIALTLYSGPAVCQSAEPPPSTLSMHEPTNPGRDARRSPAAAEELPFPALSQSQRASAPLPVKPVAASPGDTPFPIDLPTAFRLADAQAIDIALAGQRLRVSAAQLKRANVLWLPTIYTGVDYFRHDGQQQALTGEMVSSSRSSMTIGAGPSAVFAITDAIFSPLAERQVVRARRAGVQTATNDTFLAVAEAYFNVQQARGELAGAEDARQRTSELVRQTTGLAEGLVLPVEIARTETEQARRRQAVSSARERWRMASADLVRLLRIDPHVLVEPIEPPHLRVTLLSLDQALDDLIPLALSNRPELTANRAFVQASSERLRQERYRPLVPSVMVRGGSTPVPGTLAGGAFGGGRNGHLGDFDARFDLDVQVVWELQNLGFGNGARVDERRAEQRASVLEMMRVQDRVTSDVVQAYAQAQSAAERVEEAEIELKQALDSVEKNFEGLKQVRRAGNLLVLVIRPQEAVAAVQALSQAYNNYFGASADYNRAQFRLYRALGHPARTLMSQETALDAPEPMSSSPPPAPTGDPAVR